MQGLYLLAVQLLHRPEEYESYSMFINNKLHRITLVGLSEMHMTQRLYVSGNCTYTQLSNGMLQNHRLTTTQLAVASPSLSHQQKRMHA